jgi:hypothetical protein
MLVSMGDGIKKLCFFERQNYYQRLILMTFYFQIRLRVTSP